MNASVVGATSWLMIISVIGMKAPILSFLTQPQHRCSSKMLKVEMFWQNNENKREALSIRRYLALNTKLQGSPIWWVVWWLQREGGFWVTSSNRWSSFKVWGTLQEHSFSFIVTSIWIYLQRDGYFSFIHLVNFIIIWIVKSLDLFKTQSLSEFFEDFCLWQLTPPLKRCFFSLFEGETCPNSRSFWSDVFIG